MAQDEVDFAAVWNNALNSVADTMSAPQNAFLRLARLVGLIDNTVLLAVPNDFTKGVLEERLAAPLTDALSDQLGRELHLAITVDASLAGAGSSSTSSVAAGNQGSSASYPQHDLVDLTAVEGGPSLVPGADGDPEQPARPAPGSAQALEADIFRVGPSGPTTAPRESRLNPKYTFETFVIGSSNRFAHAAAVAVAEAPAKAYNPLFVYGESGLGKTHLLHAIGHYARNLYPGVRVRYVNSEEFTNDFINSIRDDKAQAFQSRYREIDVLLIDDVQFLQRAERTQEEFFHTFNTLHNANKQIVITSDLPPKQLQGFEERMRSRFEWGLITDVQPPDLETRIAILRKKSAHEKLTASDDVLEFIASRISTNIRELEGALIRVTAFASLNRQPVDMNLAEIVLKDLIIDDHAPEITAAQIMGQTAGYFGLTIDDLCSSSRSQGPGQRSTDRDVPVS